MFRIITALFLLLASAAAASAQGLFPSLWQSQRGALLKILAVDPATGNFTGVFVSGPAGTCQGVPYDLVGRVRGPRVVLMRSDWNYCTRWHLVCMKSEQALDLHSRWLQKLAVDEARRVRPRPSL